MRNLSIAIVEGNLTADPEFKTVNVKSVVNFSIALNQGDNVSYIEIQAWDSVAENCQKYLKKGSSVTVMGSIKQDRWKSPDGTMRSKIYIVANNVRFNSFNKKDDSQNDSEFPPSDDSVF